MNKHASYWQSFAVLMWIVAALGGHWLITPANHPTATTINVVAAWLQVVGGLALAIWGWQRAKLINRGPAA